MLNEEVVKAIIKSFGGFNAIREQAVAEFEKWKGNEEGFKAHLRTSPIFPLINRNEDFITELYKEMSVLDKENGGSK